MKLVIFIFHRNDVVRRRVKYVIKEQEDFQKILKIKEVISVSMKRYFVAFLRINDIKLISKEIKINTFL